MTRVTVALAVFAAVCVETDLAAQVLVSYVSYNNGKALESVITADAIDRTPAWDESTADPPLSARSAMKLADGMKDKLVHDAEDGRWERVATELRSATANHWYWLARYELQKAATGPVPDLIILVLMDGTVIKPQAYPERKFVSVFGGGSLNQEGYFLNGTRITDEELANLRGLHCLQSMNLGSSEITDSGLKHVKGLVQLRALCLSSKKITDVGLENLRGLDQLESLSLESPSITDAGLKHLGVLTHLRDLRLEDSAVTGPGLEHLKQLERLTDLNLAGTRVASSGLEYLKGLTQLKMLNLEGTPVADAGMVQFRELIQLQDLNLRGTRVTDRGLDDLKELQQLVRLDLRDTRVTDDGVKLLQKALPNCEIHR